MYRCIIEEKNLKDINEWFGPIVYNNKIYYIKDSNEKIKYALNVDISYPYLRDSPFRVKLPIVNRPGLT